MTVVDGEVVGTQGLFAESFGVRRTAGTGSWLGLEHQGRGIGKEMRAAVLHLLFDGLGALRAETGAFEDNAQSIGVTRSLGYRENGELIVDREGNRTRELLFVLDRADWATRRRDDIEIVGLEPCLPLFGLSGPGDSPGKEKPQIPTSRVHRFIPGEWLSLVERCVRDAEVVGSNPASPTHPAVTAQGRRGRVADRPRRPSTG